VFIESLKIIILINLISKLIIISQMSSGDSEIPPTYYFSGITFNPDFYTSSSSTYITKISGKKYFLSYPKAQGDETINRIYTQNISSITPTEAFNFLDTQTGNIYIGENTTGTSGQIIKIGASALTNTKIGDLSIIANSINNATNSGTRGVKIADAQTASGADLDLGAHVDRSGDINIGTGNTSATPNINIGAVIGSIRAGATISIGKLTTNAITIGHSTANITISSSTGSIKTPALSTGTFTASSSITANGGITIPSGKTLSANGGIVSSTVDTATGGTMAIGASATNGITLGAGNASTSIAGALTVSGVVNANIGLALGNGYGITCGSTSYTPATTQIGYYLNATIPSGIGMTAGTLTTLQTTSALGIGIYWICFSGYFNGFANNTGYFVPTFVTTNITSTIGSYQLGGNSGANVGFSYSGVIKVNVSSATVVFQGQWTGSGATLAGGSYSLIRIA